MLLKEFIDKLLDMKTAYGEDIPVTIAGAYGSTGIIENITIDDNEEELIIVSDIMSGW